MKFNFLDYLKQPFFKKSSWFLLITNVITYNIFNQRVTDD